jgi:hypothetical protein
MRAPTSQTIVLGRVPAMYENRPFPAAKLIAEATDEFCEGGRSND